MSVTSSARRPPRSWLTVKLERPLFALALPKLHPTGSDATHGTRDAVRTDCALIQSGSMSEVGGQPTRPTSSGVRRSLVVLKNVARLKPTSRTRMSRPAQKQ